MEHGPAELIVKDVRELGVSLSLAHLFEINNLSCLKDLLIRPMDEWFNMAGFSQHLLNELLNYLGNNRLLFMVKE